MRSITRKLLPTTEPGTRVYAIGDIHGRHDLLVALFFKILAEEDEREPAHVRFVLLGDLVNRGRKSRQVLEFIEEWPSKRRPLIVLRGNHEETLLKAWEGEAAALRQLHHMGVRPTLASYGVDVAGYATWSLDQLHDALKRAVPRQHIDMLARLPLTWQSGDYVFAHANLDPRRPLEEQDRATLLWGVTPYDPKPLSRLTLVHGHRNLAEALNERNRICVDTTAYRSERLTAVGLDGTERWFLDTASAHPAATAGGG